MASSAELRIENGRVANSFIRGIGVQIIAAADATACHRTTGISAAIGFAAFLLSIRFVRFMFGGFLTDPASTRNGFVMNGERK
jgi:hypothetical protein